MSLTNYYMQCYVSPLEYIDTNTHTHTHTHTHKHSLTDKQDTLAEFHKSSNLVKVESKTKRKLYPSSYQSYAQCAHAHTHTHTHTHTRTHTHRCFHEALTEI